MNQVKWGGGLKGGGGGGERDK